MYDTTAHGEDGEDMSKLEGIITSLHEHWHLKDLVDIQNLPDEILQEIFCCVANRSGVEFSIKPAVILSVVCRRWRHLVLEISALWGRINQDEFLLMPCALSRSRNAPLFISWQLDYGADIVDDSDDSDDTDDIYPHAPDFGNLPPLQLALKNMHRVERLESTSGLDGFEALERDLLQPSPMLQVLSLHSPEDYFDITWEASKTLATHSPNLRSLSLEQVDRPWPGCARSWKNLG